MRYKKGTPEWERSKQIRSGFSRQINRMNKKLEAERRNDFVYMVPTTAVSHKQAAMRESASKMLESSKAARGQLDSALLIGTPEKRGPGGKLIQKAFGGEIGTRALGNVGREYNKSIDEIDMGISRIQEMKKKGVIGSTTANKQINNLKKARQRIQDGLDAYSNTPTVTLRREENLARSARGSRILSENELDTRWKGTSSRVKYSKEAGLTYDKGEPTLRIGDLISKAEIKDRAVEFGKNVRTFATTKRQQLVGGMLNRPSSDAYKKGKTIAGAAALAAKRIFQPVGTPTSFAYAARRSGKRLREASAYEFNKKINAMKMRDQQREMERLGEQQQFMLQQQRAAAMGQPVQELMPHEMNPGNFGYKPSYDPRDYTPEETQGGFWIPAEKMPRQSQDQRSMMAKDGMLASNYNPFMVDSNQMQPQRHDGISFRRQGEYYQPEQHEIKTSLLSMNAGASINDPDTGLVSPQKRYEMATRRPGDKIRLI